MSASPVPLPQPHLLFSLAGGSAVVVEENTAVTVASAVSVTVVESFVESAMVASVPDRVQHTKVSPAAGVATMVSATPLYTV